MRIEEGLDLAAIVVAVVAAVLDLRTKRIPIWLTWPALFVGPLVYLALGGVLAAVWSVASLLVCALVPMALWWGRAIGEGDVKLLAAMGGLCGMTAGLEIEMIAFVAVCLWAIGRAVWRGDLVRTLGATTRTLLNPLKREQDKKPLPDALRLEVRLAPAVLAGAVLALLPGLVLGWLR
jgi:Flp pilus assembly protein protease CpaA